MHILIGLILTFILLALFRNRGTRRCRWRRDRSADNQTGFMFKYMMCGAQTYARTQTPLDFCMNDNQPTK